MLVKKDVLHLVQHRILRGGGKSSSQTSTLQTITRVIQVMSIRCYLQHVSMCVFTVAS